MRIVLGVSGGVAAYKAAELARDLIRRGHEVTAVLTRAAQEFISPLTFASLTGRRVVTDLFSGDGSPDATLSSAVEHIGVAREHDLLLVAPATANTLAKFAHGLADDFLSTLYLAFSGPVVLAPAMNDHMWDHEATRANISVLRARGHAIVGPGAGYLACGTMGEGRLADNLSIIEAIETGSDLRGETILITAGPTQEPIDPVRFVSNRSSGRMGYALAEDALSRGARVILITGPVGLEPPRNAETIRVTTAAEMYDAVFANVDRSTAVIMCAAVADYRPSAPTQEKLKKSAARLTLELEPTRDILADLGARRRPRVLIGFAAETEDLENHARAKLEAKNCHMIVANIVGVPGSGFDSEENEVLLVFRDGRSVPVPRASKREIARKILDQIANLR